MTSPPSRRSSSRRASIRATSSSSGLGLLNCSLLTARAVGTIDCTAPTSPPSRRGARGSPAAVHSFVHGSGPAAIVEPAPRGFCLAATSPPGCRETATSTLADILDSAVIHAIDKVLDEQALERAVDKALAKLRSGTDRHADRRMHIERELSLIESKLGRLVEAITAGEQLDVLVAQVKAEE